MRELASTRPCCSDASSHRISTRDTLQDTARIQFENNKKARKVTRRPGNAKPKWEQKEDAAAPVAPSAPVNETAINEGRIEMMKFDLESISAEKRAELLLRH